jgi:uncharacterized membrane protein YhiD involved in acid resistance
MGVNIEAFHTRIVSFMTRFIKCTIGVTQDVAMGNQILVLGLIVIVLLMIKGLESNPGSKDNQEKIDQLTVHLQNEKDESEAIKSLLETQKQEMKEIKYAHRDLGTKFHKVAEVMTEVTTNYKEIEQTVKETFLFILHISQSGYTVNSSSNFQISQRLHHFNDLNAHNMYIAV